MTSSIESLFSQLLTQISLDLDETLAPMNFNSDENLTLMKHKMYSQNCLSVRSLKLER